MLASAWNGTLHVGVTSYLIGRIWQHKQDLVEGFTRQYRVHNLVWHELHVSMPDAILREKRVKEWRRAWKVALIEASNPDWRDLYPDLF
jgi:putative endonuclease